MSSAEKPEPTRPAAAAPPAWWQDVVRLGEAGKELLVAQFGLLSAELGLARSALSLLLLMGLLATVAGVALAITLLILLGFALAHWLHSWIWALVVMAALQMVGLLVAILVFRRCMHWMSLPQTRGEWRQLVQSVKRKSRRRGEQEEEEAA